MRNTIPNTLITLSLLTALHTAQAENKTGPGVNIEPLPGEKHFKNLRQLTFSGQNAEAYFSHDGKELIFQSTREDLACEG